MPGLHTLLSRLGFPKPIPHPERGTPGASDWVVDEAFHPEPGQSYELAFGRIPFAGEYRQVLKRVRIDGPTRNDWFDLDERAALDLELHDFPVIAYRVLP